MARKSRKYLRDLAKRMEPRMRESFLLAIDRIQGNARVNIIAQLLREGRIAEVVESLGIERAIFNDMEDTLTEAFMTAGEETTDTFGERMRLEAEKRAKREADDVARSVRRGAIRSKLLFDTRNPRAEAQLRVHSSNLVQELVGGQKEVIRGFLTRAMEQGRNPKSVALDLAGRWNPALRMRTGGILGLTENQVSHVERARRQLASGNPTQLRAYLNRQLRDKRFDRTVMRAINNGTRLPQQTVNNALTKYRSNYLRKRAEDVARTETIGALHAGQREAFDQAMDKGLVEAQNIKRIWRSTGDGVTRDSHIRIHGETVGFNERFSNGLLYPAEPGGPPGEVINCRCWLETDIDFLAGVR